MCRVHPHQRHSYAALSGTGVWVGLPFVIEDDSVKQYIFVLLKHVLLRVSSLLLDKCDDCYQVIRWCLSLARGIVGISRSDGPSLGDRTFARKGQGPYMLFRDTCSPAALIDLLCRLTCYLLSYITKAGIIIQFWGVGNYCHLYCIPIPVMSSPPGTLFARQWRASAFA